MDTIINKIIDIHTHILPGVDDGVKNIEESIEIIKALKKIGFESVFLTSHYMENTEYNSNIKERKKILSDLNLECDINLYLGNEVFVTENILNLKNKKEITTLNNSKYLLIELPLHGYNKNLSMIICELTSKNIIPIIAHPERYEVFDKHFELLEELIDYGCLLQCNIGSIVGMYGRKAKRLMKRMLKKDMVSFIGTDIHSIKELDKIKRGYWKLYKLVGNNRYLKYTYSNPKMVVENKKLG